MTIGLWQTLRCKDADAEIAWLKAIGFTERNVYRNDADETIVEHAELLWPAGGGVMLGSVREASPWKQEVGVAGTYLVVDDPDGLHATAVAAGGTSVMEPTDQDYGSRDSIVRDPEGNLWSFGTYAPA